MSDFGSITKWFDNISDTASALISCIPDFLRPLVGAFIVISAVYLIVGRD